MEKEQATIESYVAHLKNWIEDCNERHDNECQVVPIAERPPHHIPDWVIDTEDACIVCGASVPRYVALSYGNLDDFRTKGFLRTGVLDKAPVVVRDAIHLVQLSGCRYLWVDCLCIVQHADTTDGRVGLMNEIYSGAHFTIIAAAESARGLYGRDQRHAAYISEGKPSASSLHAELLCSHWASRGWTFQEQLLSRRALVFLDDVYFWDCLRGVHCPDVLPVGGRTGSEIAHRKDRKSHEPPQYAPAVGNMSERGRDKLRLEATPSPTPDLKLYIELVCRYNMRNLTYDQDALPAFSGVLEAFSRQGFLGGFVCGLPALFLDSALLWQPATHARRRRINKFTPNIAPQAPLPSWSWIGWQCRLDPDSMQPDLIKGVNPDHRQREFPSYTIEKPVDWSTFPVESPINGNGALISCITTRAVLRVRSVLVPYDPSSLVRFAERRWESGSLSSVSVFDTGIYAQIELWDFCPVLTLEDSEGRWAGTLQVMNRESRPKIRSGLKLIAISTGSMPFAHADLPYQETVDSTGSWAYPWINGSLREKRYEFDTHNSFSRRSRDKTRQDIAAGIDVGPFARLWASDINKLKDDGAGGESPETVNQPEQYQFYNVLSVRAIDGIMYRMAAGRVPKDIWERNCGEPEKIVLG
ncbi:uncharacterized protein PG986_014203 [Apiospora aurea]|uniref:Heterokaryon incompatibility domain-containing protein n=1 Tax=Apiospora aurea TaxID=335848 RepID=A0ABR1PSA9_9PEZI